MAWSDFCQIQDSDQRHDQSQLSRPSTLIPCRAEGRPELRLPFAPKREGLHIPAMSHDVVWRRTPADLQRS